MKKNSRRRHEARISRTVIASDECHRPPPDDRRRARRRPGGRRAASAARRRSPRPTDRASRARASHARAFRTCEQQVEDVPAVVRVEIAGRLVGEDQRRIVGQRARDGDALLLAARQLRRVVMSAIVQADLVEQRLRARAARRAGRRSPSAPGCSRARSATARGERTGRRSRSSRRAAAPGCLRRARVMSTPSMRMLPLRRRVEPGDQAEQRGLAAARTDR